MTSPLLHIDQRVARLIPRHFLAFGIVGFGGYLVDVGIFNALRLGLFGHDSTASGPIAANVISVAVATLDDPAALNQDFNIPNPTGLTVVELAEIIWRKIKGPDAPLRLVHDHAFEFDLQRVPDVTKARGVLGFEAPTTLEDMLNEVIPWISNAIETGAI